LTITTATTMTMKRIQWSVLIFSIPEEAASGLSEKAIAGEAKTAIAATAEAVIESRVRNFLERDSTARPF